MSKSNVIAYFNAAVLLGACLIAPATVAADDPWRLQSALNAPDWLAVSGQSRVRFEHLDEQYRASSDGSDHALMLRTLLKAELRLEALGFVLELQDSRVNLADSATPLTTSSVNPLDVLRAYAEISSEDLFTAGSSSRLRVGRITIDVGSRRLVARIRFRNTLNAFTGVDWQWIGKDEQQLRLFYTLPIQRRVDGSVLDNNPKADRADSDISFWGAYYAPAQMPWGDEGEAYLFGLDEQDVSGRATKDRNLYTAGFRLYRKPARQRFSYLIESVFQTGESRSSTSATSDLDHAAHFQHAEMGYTFDTPSSLQLLVQYDYASGDDDPNDGDNNRFETLFGARRFDFGPTSIYGPFARSNLRSLGLRLKLKPTADVTSTIAWRTFRLASSDDAWTTARISGAPGKAETFIGSQIEFRLRWEVIPGNVRIESGAARLFAGDLMDHAAKKDATYVYSQLVFSY